jgi:hypothetical protein
MKVKLFVRHSLEELEQELGEWMEHQDIRICHVAQSQCEKQGRFVFVLSLFYQTPVGSYEE